MLPRPLKPAKIANLQPNNFPMKNTDQPHSPTNLRVLVAEDSRLNQRTDYKLDKISESLVLPVLRGEAPALRVRAELTAVEFSNNGVDVTAPYARVSDDTEALIQWFYFRRACMKALGGLRDALAD